MKRPWKSEKESRLNRLINSLPIILLAVLLLITAADVAAWYTSPEAVRYDQRGTVRTAKLSEATYKNCKLENGQYTVTGKSPQIKIKAPEYPVGGIVLHLGSPLAENTTVRVYYTLAGEKKTNANSIKVTGYAGLSEIAVNIPADQYRFLRFRIMGDMAIDQITLSDEATVQTHRPYSFRWLRILAVFLPCALLICLYRYNDRFRRGLGTLHRKVIQPETRWAAVNWIYGIFACAMMLHHIYILLYMPVSRVKGEFVFEIFWYVFAGMSILLGRMWKDKGFWLLAILLGMKFFRTVLPDYAGAASVWNVFVNSIYAYFCCYAVGRALKESARRKLTIAFIILWTVGMTIYCGAGVYTAWTGNILYNLGDKRFFISSKGRLTPLLYCVTAGLLFSISCAVTMVGMTATKKRALRWLWLPSLLVMIMAADLTVTRTAYIIIAGEAALVLCFLLWDRWISGRPGNGIRETGSDRGTFRQERYRNAGKWAVLVALFGILVVGLSFVQSKFVGEFNHLKENGSLLPTATAEETVHQEEEDLPEENEIIDEEEREIQNRDFVLDGDMNDFLNGRAVIWSSALQVLREHPNILLWGKSCYEPMTEINEVIHQGPYINYVALHCHNRFFQTVIETGIFGLLICIVFFIRFVVAAFRLMINKQLPIWIRLISLPGLACLAADLIDYTCRVNLAHPQMTLMFFFIGITIAEDQAARKLKKGSEA